MATVNVSAEALKQVAKLPRVMRERIGKVFERLEDWPEVSGAEPLSGKLAGWYRIRSGDYRIRFCVVKETVLVDKIGPRKDFSED